MKKGYIILIAVLVIVAGFLVIRKMLQKSISFDFNLGGNASDILGLVQGRYAAAERSGQRAGLYFDIPLTTIVKNDGAAKVILENIAGSVSYNGEPVLQTRPNSPALSSVEIAKRGSQSITDNVQLLINESTIKFLQEIIKGNKPKVLYNFSTVIFGKPKNFTNSTTINNQ